MHPNNELSENDHTPNKNDSSEEVDPDQMTEIAYAEDTPLTWVFGNHPEVKLIAAFLSEPDVILNKKEASNLADVSRPAVSTYLEPMIECGAIQERTRSGQVQMYSLGDIEAIDTFRRLESKLLSQNYDTTKEFPKGSAGTDPNPELDVVEPYAEDTPLTWVFGDHPESKIVAAMLSEPDYAFSITDWSTVAGVSRGAVNNHSDQMVQYGIVEDLGTQGRKHLYQLADTEITQLVRTLESQLLRSWYEINPDTTD